MTDPYQVLCVPRSASDEQIKTAYRELARKYHPDNYVDNPLSDLATEKMKEINEAYDKIMESRRNGGGNQSYNGSGAYRGSTYGGYADGISQFADIRRLINTKRITEAEELLDGVPEQKRDAEWHFLKGNVLYTRGWLDDAYDHFAKAYTMNPDNPEFRTAYHQMQWQRQTARSGGAYRTSPYHTGGCSMCDVCATLYCADCCCGMMGGRCC